MLTTLAGEVLHELQTPLHFLRTVMQSSADADREQMEDNVVLARDEVERLERLVASARRMQLPPLVRAPFRVRSAVWKVLTVLRTTGRWSGPECAVDIAEDLTLDADPDRLRQVFVNLLRNAQDALHGTHKRVGVRARSCEDGDVELDVWDDGPGVSPSLEPQLFRAFRSTKPNGSGLGLVVCAKITRELGWSLGYLREDDRTVFRIRVPASDVLPPSA